jgi:hypothetical protein
MELLAAQRVIRGNVSCFYVFFCQMITSELNRDATFGFREIGRVRDSEVGAKRVASANGEGEIACRGSPFSFAFTSSPKIITCEGVFCKTSIIFLVVVLFCRPHHGPS